MVDLSKEVQEDFTKKADFSSLKTKADKNESDNDNLESIINKNDAAIKTIVNTLKTKVDGINLSNCVLKSNYNDKVGNFELKIPGISGKLNIFDFNRKVIELENKIKAAENKPDISNLATKSRLTRVENKIPDVKGFVKLSDYSTEITKIKNDYVTNAALTSQLNSLKNQHISDEIKKVDDKLKKILLIL